ncbi:hypothetical protein WA026_016320 [Henosepilachna vigintioctopunctata]|uniref:Fibrinogen C-terminal domain-containing protein n=1 Tax=Henosepilachna vigintioctopunctata TaxID=420089 RepID=A0AAW1UEM9_9CUCU
MRTIIDSSFYLCLIVFSSLATVKGYKNASESEYSNNNQCHTGQIEYKLTKLEVLTAERSESVKSELRENNRRLQALEWQNADVGSAIESLKNELSRFTSSGQISYSRPSSEDKDVENLNEKLEVLSKGIHLAVAAIKLNNVELKSMKQDLASVTNNTRKIVADYHQLLNKEFFNDALVEMKHRINVRHVSSDKCNPQNEDKPKDCVDLKKNGKKSGVYKIYPDNYHQGFMVLCEMEASGGGWAVVQNRLDGSQNFYLGWRDYKHGFGNLGGEFWLGLDNLYYLTGHEVNELVIELVDHASTKKFAHYGSFSIGSEMEGYSLKLLSQYQGDAGDSLTYHAGSRFSTKDMDQDSWEEGSCAKSHSGAWWYNSCDTSNLNGKYLGGELPDNFIYQGMYWGEFRGAQYSLKQVRMMVRPRDKAEENF